MLSGARDAAQAFLSGHPETVQRIDRVLDLIEGFESAYSIELLATVHWVVARAAVPTDDDSVIGAVHAWSARKRRMFPPDHIRTVLGALRDRGWAPTLVTTS